MLHRTCKVAGKLGLACDFDNVPRLVACSYCNGEKSLPSICMTRNRELMLFDYAATLSLKFDYFSI